LIESCADHIHWGGGFWDTSIGGIHNEFGGGHAHAGAMIYLGDNWPEEFRGNLFTINIHGQRLNRDAFSPRGSGVVASHRDDPVLSTDPWFRGIEVKYGPDGGVYLTDWNDIGECHDYDEVQRDTGRIFKITHGRPAAAPVNLAALSDLELVGLQTHSNEWHVRTSRRLLQERAAVRPLDGAALTALPKLLENNNGVERLRAIWSLHATGSVDAATINALLADKDEHVRSWAVRLEVEDRAVTRGRLLQFAEMARFDLSPGVRVELAAALQRLPKADRWPIARELARHDEDARDHNLPLMIWYGIEPLAGDAAGRDLELLGTARIPLVQRYLARRIASEEGGVDRLVAWLGTSDAWTSGDAAAVGLRDAVEGRRRLSMPAGWPDVSARATAKGNAAVREAIDYLALLFGDAATFDRLVATAADKQQPVPPRRTALETLIQVPHPKLVTLLQSLLDDPALAGPALRGLPAYDDPATGKLIVDRYARFTADQRQEAIGSLAARKASAVALVDAIAAGRIPSRDVSPYVVRQLRDYEIESINRRLEQLWGSVRATPQEKAQRMADYAAQLTPAAVKSADAKHGKALFVQKCAQCHRLFGDGAAIGPELTGAQRTSVDYLLQNIVDPSAAVPREYRVHTVITTDGRLLNGVVPEETTRTVTLQTPTERIVLDRADIEEIKPTSVSMMPEGLLDALTAEERRDLIAYLSAPGPLPAGQ
jgi:putative heme-binding domain-containing protein